MIESAADLQQFHNDNLVGDWFLHVIPTDDAIHPCATKRCILFVRNLSTSKTYYYSFCHPDSVPSVGENEFLQMLSKTPNRKWAFDKKSFDQLLNLPAVLDANLASYMTKNITLELSDYETAAHFMVRRNASGHRQINQVVPLTKHLELFNELADDFTNPLKKYDVDISFFQFNNQIIETLGMVEREGIFVDREKFHARFDVDCGNTNLVYSQYNVYTSTGRPSNRYGGINYAALNQTDGSRECFVSRYGKDGLMVVVDYTAFHPRIICQLTNYSIDVKTDIYEYLAKLYFQKKQVDETDVANAKQLTFRQLYGGVESKYAHIRYLANLKDYIAKKWDEFERLGYVTTPHFGRRITDRHLLDPNPNKLFNYILQAVEGEIAIPRIKAVIEYLTSNRKLSKPVLYTYDAMLYDFHKADGIQTLNEIRHIMSHSGAFSMKTYMGKSYQDVRLVSL